MPTLDNLDKTDKTKPAEVRILIQRFGGKKPAEEPTGEIPKKKKRGGAPGFIEYEDVTKQVPDQVKIIQEFFDSRIKLYQEGKE